MMAASDALIALGSPESLDGLVSWARRKFGPIAAADPIPDYHWDAAAL